ncbi:helix-turn-helix transcriptional regulator [Aquabacter sp. P-9]|uniref:helix-turn-helix transcriptional regulator n=1 Tax=Aquabacter sediminis TaxID=3029197 RepID=UPI00237E4E0D|nr:AraC family transcriptional regulator [Aquabacter sp. P-9]MDE1570796.1 AraC family transcriptional regulator [Aquabacter sp. P-9]
MADTSEVPGAAMMGIASDSRWMLPNGFDSLDLPSHAPGLPDSVVQVSYPQFSLRPGLEVYTFEARVRAPVNLTYEVLTGEPYLWLALNFCGRNLYVHDGGMEGAILPASSHFAMLRDPSSTFHYGPGHHVTSGMAVTPARLEEMLQGQRPSRTIAAFLDGTFDPFIASAAPTAAMRTIAEQIARNPYRGGMETLYLEGKAFEMLAEYLSAFCEDAAPAPSGRARRLALAAREILMADPAHPPRIEEVAAQVGLSQRRLNEVFRDVFGASPLQCLVRWRLDLARQWLSTGDLSVKQVAHRLGYAHASNFSLAYTRRFGHPPTGAPETTEPAT